jgi:rhodanese-related sulfurtransferase
MTRRSRLLRSRLRRAARPAAILAALVLAGCGSNRFEQEVETEKAALKLARETASGGYQLIGTDELKALLDQKTPCLVVDTMPAAESFKKEHIPGALSFEFPKEPMTAEWEAAKTAGKSAEDYRALLGPDPERPIIVYCGFVACARSHNAAVWALKQGFKNVRRHPGGIYAWKGAGHATESAP